MFYIAELWSPSETAGELARVYRKKRQNRIWGFDMRWCYGCYGGAV